MPRSPQSAVYSRCHPSPLEANTNEGTYVGYLGQAKKPEVSHQRASSRKSWFCSDGLLPLLQHALPTQHQVLHRACHSAKRVPCTGAISSGGGPALPSAVPIGQQ